MKVCSFFLHFALLIIAGSLGANAKSIPSYQDINKLRGNVAEHVKEHFLELNPELKEGVDLFIEVGQLDSRLKLHSCDGFLTLKLNKPPHASSQVSVKTSCESGARWTLYIPVKVEIYQNVLVASQDIPRGVQLNQKNVKFMSVNTSSFGFGLIQASSSSDAYGMETTRPLRIGRPINIKYLKKPDIVTKGDKVVLESSSSTLKVSANGTALDNGHIGKRIRVRNNQSKRIVDALIVGPGKVNIAAN